MGVLFYAFRTDTESSLCRYFFRLFGHYAVVLSVSNFLSRLFCFSLAKRDAFANDSHLRNEALLKFEGYRCTDNSFISVSVANGNMSNSQTANQMNELRFKYEIKLEGLKYSKRNVTYNSVG